MLHLSPDLLHEELGRQCDRAETLGEKPTKHLFSQLHGHGGETVHRGKGEAAGGGGVLGGSYQANAAQP